MKSLTRPAAFIAPGGKAVYFADYVYVGNRVVQMRSNLGAAQIDAQQSVALDEPRTDMTFALTDQNVGDEDLGRDQVAEPLQSLVLV